MLEVADASEDVASRKSNQRGLGRAPTRPLRGVPEGAPLAARSGGAPRAAKPRTSPAGVTTGRVDASDPVPTLVVDGVVTTERPGLIAAAGTLLVPTERGVIAYEATVDTDGGVPQ